MFTKGQIVFSKCGRDKGNPFIVFLVDDEKDFIYLVDGKLHKLNKAKKKKFKHVQHTNDINVEIANMLETNQYLNDATIRKVLLPYKNNR